MSQALDPLLEDPVVGAAVIEAEGGQELLEGLEGDEALSIGAGLDPAEEGPVGAEGQDGVLPYRGEGDGQEGVLTNSRLSRYTGLRDAFVCLLYTSPSPRDGLLSRMPSSA